MWPRRKYGYNLSKTCDEIRPTYQFNESCQETVPQAIIAFLDSRDFESAIRLAVSLGGDSDTLACITGGIAEAFYGMTFSIPDTIDSCNDINMYFIRQSHPKGLGDAVLTAKAFIGDEPFVVLLGDDLMQDEVPLTKQLIEKPVN